MVSGERLSPKWHIDYSFQTRFARYYDKDGKLHRTLFKAYGIRYVVLVYGQVSYHMYAIDIPTPFCFAFGNNILVSLDLKVTACLSCEFWLFNDSEIITFVITGAFSCALIWVNTKKIKITFVSSRVVSSVLSLCFWIWVLVLPFWEL